MILVFSNIYPGIELLDHTVTIFSFLRNLHTVFLSSCINLHSHWSCRRVLFSLHPCQQLLCVLFLVTATLTGVRWYCGFELHSPDISEAERLFMWLLAICVSSMGKCLFSSSAQFSIAFFDFPMLSYMSYLYTAFFFNFLGVIKPKIKQSYQTVSTNLRPNINSCPKTRALRKCKNQNKVSPHTGQNGPHQKVYKQ